MKSKFLHSYLFSACFGGFLAQIHALFQALSFRSAVIPVIYKGENSTFLRVQHYPSLIKMIIVLLQRPFVGKSLVVNSKVLFKFWGRFRVRSSLHNENWVWFIQCHMAKCCTLLLNLLYSLHFHYYALQCNSASFSTNGWNLITDCYTFFNQNGSLNEPVFWPLTWAASWWR